MTILCASCAAVVGDLLVLKTQSPVSTKYRVRYSGNLFDTFKLMDSFPAMSMSRVVSYCVLRKLELL